MIALLVSCERSTKTGPDEVATGNLGTVVCIRERGTVACRGPNELGTLGDGGARAHADEFVAVNGPVATRQVRVSSAETFVCARGAEKVWCWGEGPAIRRSTGQPARDIALPRAVVGLPPADDLTVGLAHACALTGDGRAFCWGDNIFGAVGDIRVHPEREMMATVVHGFDFKQVVAGPMQTCGVTRSLDAYCWGGAVPDGDTVVPAFGPTLVGRQVERVFVSPRSEMCVVRRSAGDLCWMSVNQEVADVYEALRVRNGGGR